MKRFLFIIMLITIVGCGTDTVNKGSGDIRFYKDENTKCEYIIYHQVQGVAIYPRMNKEGKQVCD